jgi:hypothetical protein
LELTIGAGIDGGVTAATLFDELLVEFAGDWLLVFFFVDTESLVLSALFRLLLALLTLCQTYQPTAAMMPTITMSSSASMCVNPFCVFSCFSFLEF